jgi:serine/threonine protein phosphatase PrpC
MPFFFGAVDFEVSHVTAVTTIEIWITVDQAAMLACNFFQPHLRTAILQPRNLNLLGRRSIHTSRSWRLSSFDFAPTQRSWNCLRYQIYHCYMPLLKFLRTQKRTFLSVLIELEPNQSNRHRYSYFYGRNFNSRRTSDSTDTMKLSRQATASVALIMTAATVVSFQPVPLCRAEQYRFVPSTATPQAAVRKGYENDDFQNTSSENFSQKVKRPPSCPFYGCPLRPVDIHYNTDDYKKAFTMMRNDKRIVVMQQNAANVLASSATDQHTTLTLIGYKGGALQEQINQDRALIIAPFRIVNNPGASQESQLKLQTSNHKDFLTTDRILLGVFDGHAPLGEGVSEHVSAELPKLLATKLSLKARDYLSGNTTTLTEEEEIHLTKEALTESFVELDRTAPANPSGGCTASVVFLQGRKVYIANTGDSRSFVVAYRPSTNSVTVVYISREDKPHIPEERARVEAAGGQVYIPAKGTSRVVYHDPSTGAPTGLAMSRSIGDWEAGKMGVIPDPIVDVLDIHSVVADVMLDDTDPDLDADSYQVNPMIHAVNSDLDDVYLFAVSATDGLMDYLTATDISRILAHSLFDDSGAHPVTAVEHLIFAAANAWQEEKQGHYRDDIAIAVSVLRRPPNEPSIRSIEIHSNGM